MAASCRYNSSSLRVCVLIGVLLQLLSVSSHPVFKYPPGIIPCKTFNKTSLDCSNRLLTDLPPLHQNFTAKLNMSFNLVKEIKGESFKKLTLLLRLDLSNNAISKISEVAFAGLNSLEYLYLQSNQLRYLPYDVFNDLKHLIKLDLSQNLFRIIPPRINWTALYPLKYLSVDVLKPASIEISKEFQNLKNLTIFQLSITKLTSNITNDTFKHLSGLPIRSLGMTWTQGKIVDHEITVSLPNLALLFISHEAFNVLKFACSKIQLMQLTGYKANQIALNASLLKTLAKWNSTLTYLIVRDLPGKRRTLPDFTFRGTPHLITLDLSINEINHLSTFVFSGLNHLEVLNLAHNDLKEVPSHTFHAFQSGSLRNLDLSFNGISDIESEAFSSISFLKYLSLAGNYIIMVHWLDVFINIISINIDENERYPYGENFFSNSSSLQNLHVNKDTSIRFGTDGMCTMFPNLAHVTLSNIQSGIDNFTSSLVLHKCLQLIELDLSYSIQSWIFDRIDIHMPNLKVLNLSGNKLNYVHQFLFIKANLTSLDLSRNNLQTLEGNDLLSFPSLIHLNLERNFLTSIEGLQNLKFLRYLNLAENQLHVAPKWLFFKQTMINLPLNTLDLSNNPFRCSCDIDPLRNWILSDTATYVIGTKYACATPVILEGESITAIELDCRDKTGLYVSIGIPCTLLTMVLISLLFKYRWHIKYKLHLLFRNYYPFPDVDEEFELMEGTSALQYHAYVAYNDDARCDEDWVLNDLQPHMEEGPDSCYLCIKSRDFTPGHPLIETISEKINQSRKTILVLTPQFVESEWCYHEMEMAQMLLFQEERDVLVLVLLQNIPERKITLSLRKLLCKKRYLKWPNDIVGQGLFWQRLKDELKAPVHINRRCDF